MTFKKTLTLALALSAFAVAPMAHAGFYLQETVNLTTGTSNAGSTTSADLLDTKTTDINLRGTAGFTLGGRFLIGGTANIALGSGKVEGISTVVEANTNGSDFGPAVGFVQGGFHLIGSYLFLGSYTSKSKVTVLGTATTDEETKYTKPAGFQIDMGYAFQLSPALRIGPSLVYRSVKYSKQSFTNNLDATENTSDVDLLTKAKDSGLTAAITVALAF
ncbi:MAG: hypothetical protein NDJ89_01930 [Oligoflexia bacterium]|nr:hypothetical protein [Oligoflexia bacterium]